MTRHRSWRACFFRGGVIALWVTAAAASVGHAHMAKSTSSLRSLVAGSDLVIRARVRQLDSVVVPDGAKEKRRDVLRVEVLEVVKGSSKKGRVLPISQHGHGIATYRPGEEALFFLRPLSKSRELHKLAATGELKWLSTQEHDEAYSLDSEDSRELTLRAVRGYVAIEHAPKSERTPRLRSLTLKLLRSRDPGLGTSALRDLAREPNAPLVTREEIPALRKVVHDPKTTIGVRVGLLKELDRRELLNSDADWLRLLWRTEGGDRIAVIRAAGSHPSPVVNHELGKLLKDSDTAVASAAAISLGSPGNAAAVAPLREALLSKEKRLSMAAIRALGAIGNTEARAALGSVAESHPDPSVRRRAAAELHVLQGRDSR